MIHYYIGNIHSAGIAFRTIINLCLLNEITSYIDIGLQASFKSCHNNNSLLNELESSIAELDDGKLFTENQVWTQSEAQPDEPNSEFLLFRAVSSPIPRKETTKDTAKNTVNLLTLLSRICSPV